MPQDGIDVGGLSLSTEASAAERARDLPALENQECVPDPSSRFGGLG